jgi:Lon protease-like protein
LQLPRSAPVMILPGCNFFPFTPLPLRIFEPRYRTMLALALEGDRMFCIGTRVAAGPEEAGLPVDEGAGIYVHGTLGLVRACVTADDGTSNLLLEGLRRVLFTGWIREEPYRIAILHPVETFIESQAAVDAGTKRTLAIAATLVERGVRCPPQLDLHLDTRLPPEMVGDVVANYFLTDLEQRHELLAMECLDDRLEFLAECLKAQLGALGPSS